MKKYILLFGVAAVSIGSYCAYAGNTATMTVTATIAHDVSLSVTQDLDMGTITINPGYKNNLTTYWTYSDSGVISYITQGAIISADNATLGTFTANIPNPSACDRIADACGGLTYEYIDIEDNFFGGNNGENGCFLNIKYSGTENIFKVVPGCVFGELSSVTAGNYSDTFTISYTPE
ncbi:MAG: hypothetical protein IJ689_03445 [Alphaproteobacteria bacterium]|nr:hypothetical protein [Alphaproteobacteria bacterium]